MTKKRSWLVFVMAVCILVLSALACVFPAEATIDGGMVPSAIDEGYATLNLTKAGCDCETNMVSGKLMYTDGKGRDKVHIIGKIDHTLDPGCEIPEDTNLWATGTYNPGKGTFRPPLPVGMAPFPLSLYPLECFHLSKKSCMERRNDSLVGRGGEVATQGSSTHSLGTRVSAWR